MPADTEEWLAADTDHQVYAVLKQFLQYFMVERNAPRTLDMLSDQVYGVGAGKSEVAIGKEAFSQLLNKELIKIPGSIFYTMTDYVQKERVPGCWDCFCNLEMTVPLTDGAQALYHVRLTVGIHKVGERYVLDTFHASEASKYQEDGEFLHLKVISRGPAPLSKETQYQLMELIGQTMPGGIVGGYIQDGFPLYVANARLLQMAGYQSYEEFTEDIGGLVINSVHPEDREYVNTEMKRVLALGDQYEIKYRMKKKDGSYIWVYDVGRRTVAANGRDAIISVLIDISRQVYDKSCLEYEAVSDPLTGIYNRKGGQTRIEKAIQHTSGYFFFMMDLDNFKLVNDLYGHQEGDKVLCFVADQLAKSFRKTDVVCRLGGDEFAVFIADCDDAACIQCKITQFMESYHKFMRKNWPRAGSTLSVGGVCGQRNRSFSELYRLADEMLYEVKNSKKGELKLRRLE